MTQKYTNAVLSDAVADKSNKRIEGWVEDFYPDRMFGFVRHEPRNGIFFAFGDVVPDVIGRRFLKPGTVVSFELTENRGRFRAAYVKDESPGLSEIDPANYWETSYVADWRGGYGFLVRPDGDRLYFHQNKIITVGLELLKSWDHVSDPVWVTHRISRATNTTGQHRFFATDIQILEPAQPSLEEMFLNAPELPIEAPQPAPEESVLAPKTRNLSLLEISCQRREGKK